MNARDDVVPVLPVPQPVGSDGVRLRQLVEVAKLHDVSVDDATTKLESKIGNDGVVDFLKGYDDRKAFKDDLERMGFTFVDAERLWRALRTFE